VLKGSLRPRLAIGESIRGFIGEKNRWG